MQITHRRVLTLIALWMMIVGSASTAHAQDDSDIRVMSFNIRFGAANDGENNWEHRKDNVIKTIADFRPDVLGSQEVLPFQAAYLRKNLTGYVYVGRSREAGAEGEQCGIMVRQNRFDILEQGHFWLSETPNVPGSKSWDSSLPRMATWVKLFDHKSKGVFYFVNTHFDHRGTIARENSAQVIIDRIKQFETGLPVVITGDFNTAPDSKPYQLLTAEFVDGFHQLHPDAKETGTFSGFKGRTDSARIDFIFSSKAIKVIEAAIDRREFDGRNPSDHFPVTSVLRLK